MSNDRSKPHVTPEMQQTLLRAIAAKGGRATTEDLMPEIEEATERDWAYTVRWALIRMHEKGWIICPFGSLVEGDKVARQLWILNNRPHQNRTQQVWQITPQGEEQVASCEVISHKPIPEEIADFELPEIFEGAKTTIIVNSYERSEEARKLCIKHFGASCVVCGFDFGKVYGLLGEGYIHVHHIKLLSQIKARYKVNPERDLVPVCPNCHAMIHSKTEPLTIAELQKIVEANKS